MPIGHRSQQPARERDGHGSSSGFRKLRKKLLDNIAEQIIKCRESERSLRRGRLAREHPEGWTQSGLHHMLPHHGLADSDIPRNDKRRRLAGADRKKGTNLAHLGLSPNRPRVHFHPPISL